MKLEHIVLTSDLSTESLRPLSDVTALAREVGARITLLHVVEDLKAAPRGAPLAPAVSAPGVGKEAEKARAELEEQANRLRPELSVDVAVLTSEDVAKAVAHYAEEHGADLIAISTHGRSGLRHMVLGSVAEGVLRHSAVPVLSFHRPK